MIWQRRLAAARVPVGLPCAGPCFALGGGRAAAQRVQRSARGAGRADGDVDVVALEHAAGHVGRVVVASAQALERGVLVAEGGQEGECELSGIERLKRQVGDGLFDFYGVHVGAGAPRARQHRINRERSQMGERLLKHGAA